MIFIGILLVAGLSWLFFFYDAPPPKPEPPCPKILTIEKVEPYKTPGWQSDGGYPVTTTDGSQYHYSMADHDNPPYKEQEICINDL